MSEFGHQGIISPLGCVDIWGAGPFTMPVGDKTIRFEDSDRFGPLFVGKRGEPKEDQFLRESSPFWRQHMLWVKQGRRLAADGVTCVWDEPKPNLFRRINRRNAVLVEAGDDDGKYVEISDADPAADGD
jgi:hypothetical protein